MVPARAPMGTIVDALKRLFGAQDSRSDPENVEGLRADFRVRYHNFKLLLGANNRALDAMAGMERALRSSEPFGMGFVRGSATTVAVNVLQMVRNLEALAPGSYPTLLPRFRAIHEEISGLLAAAPPDASSPMVVPLRQLDRSRAHEVGNKMAVLGEVASRLRLPVPSGFVVTTTGYARFLQHNDLQAEIDRRIQAAGADALDEMLALSSSIQQFVIAAPVPDELASAILEGYRALERECGAGVRVSMRSSALGEDSDAASFAGQYRSSLDVDVDELLQTYKEIVASKYTLQAMTYRYTRGIPDSVVAMCVGCMVMVDAVAGGVAYSRSPVNPSDPSVLVTAVRGLPKRVVDGAGLPDVFRVPREASGRSLPREPAVSMASSGASGEPPSGDQAVDRGAPASITGEEAGAVARLAMVLEAHFGPPQDVEWAMDRERRIFILQCRPVRLSEARDAGAQEAQADAQGAVLLRGGVTVSPGVGCGPARVIRQAADLLRFEEGDVLFTAQPLPMWAPVLDRAAAVVTEQGSIAGHLASVARELQVPALFALQGAVGAVCDRALVTVDADQRVIYAGRAEPVLRRAHPRPDLMEGSPVYAALNQVSRCVVPLTLHDPESPSFHPDSCETLHDITRFCHEKAVEEMFRFGRDHRFSERSSKQLVTDVPMQLWVINLDDGFKREVTGRLVSIDDIASTPMLALWEGMSAIPWEGPPPVDAGGFMSVMFQATANPELDPAVAGSYAERNYFMVSRQFCTLQSRFGFHFATIEALVGERPGENYASFRFRGGAADQARRVARVDLIGDLLGDYGFRVEKNGDALHARAEGLAEPIMIRKLRILGYLVHHTRQLDMVMANPAVAEERKLRMSRDIDSILGRWVCAP